MTKRKSPSWYQSPRGRALQAYRNMQERCGNKNGRNPAYSKVRLNMTKEEFLEWAIPKYEEFDKNWPGRKPNCSRIKDKGHYEKDNLEIIPFKRNLAIQHRNSASNKLRRFLKKRKLEKFVFGDKFAIKIGFKRAYGMARSLRSCGYSVTQITENRYRAVRRGDVAEW